MTVIVVTEYVNFIRMNNGVLIMIVKEFIEKLSEMPQEAEVVTPSDIWLDLYCGFDIIEEKILDDEKVVIIR